MSDPPVGTGMPETPASGAAHPRLDEDQMNRLRLLGEERAVEPEEILFAAGDPKTDFYAIESGTVVIVQGYGKENRVLGVHGARRFLGELSMISGQRLYLTGVVRDPGVVIQVPLEKLKSIVAVEKTLGDMILGSFIARRSNLIRDEAGIKLIGSRFSADSRRLREYLVRNRMPHRWIDLEEDEQADALLEGLAVEPGDTPVVVASGGEILRSPTNAEVGRAIGIASKGPPRETCDLIVIGAGPAGLAAAVYAASEGLDTQMIETVATGGQAGTAANIENYLGFPVGVSGSELTQRASLQAIKFGVRLTAPAAAIALRSSPDHHEIELSTGDTAAARAVVIATGAQYRRLDVPGIERFEMGGVYYAATQAEAQLCSGDPIVIVGGGNSAGQAAMFLSRTSPRCRLLVRAGDLGNSMSRYLIDQIERNDNVKVSTNTEVVAVSGDPDLETVTVANTENGERETVSANAIFVFIGASPHTAWLDGQLATDRAGFLLTGRDVQGEDLPEYDGEDPLFLETSRPAIFAVGDVRSGSVKRVASAVGEGSMAVRLIHQRFAAGLVESGAR